jgi:hypothetical protein
MFKPQEVATVFDDLGADAGDQRSQGDAVPGGIGLAALSTNTAGMFSEGSLRSRV